MIINRQSIAEIFSGFNTVFNKTLENTEVFYPKIAMEVPSSSSDENYGWIGGLPTMREWVGERQLQNLSAYTYNIKNKNFELTIGIDQNDLEDDKIGLFRPMLEDLAQNAKTFPDKLVFELLADSFKQKCFDGKPMISDNHILTINNKEQTFSNKMTEKLSFESYGRARAQMMSVKGEDGRSLRIIPNILCVSPQNEALAKQITMCEFIQSQTNIYKGTSEVLVVPELIDTPDAWFLLCTTRAIKPFIFQNRKSPNLVQKTNPTDDNVFFNRQFIYGVDSRCNVGFGLWQLIIGSTGEELPLEKQGN